MEKYIDGAWLAEQWQHALAWAIENIVNFGAAGQVAAILAAFLVAWRLGNRLELWYGGLAKRNRDAARDRFIWAWRIAERLVLLGQPLVWLGLLWVSGSVARAGGWPHQFITLVNSLLMAWIAIRLSSYLVRSPSWSKMIAIIAWSIAALNILGLLQTTFEILDSAAIHVGQLRLSLLSVVNGAVTLGVLLWAALFVSRVLERKLSAVPDLTPSIRLLIGNLLKIILLAIAVTVGLGAVGIDLTAFAVFGGALGVGVGFGLQKVVSNFVSGIILLLDRSVKPGDVIVIGETYGWVSSLGARYTSVITRDGAEHLIPNEDLITQRVENWSYSNKLVRLRLPIGIAYNSDVRQAIALVIEAAGEVERILAEPAPRCLLKGFGDSSVDLELRFWIRDPSAGVSNVKNDVLLSVWDKFHTHGIEIPFPQLVLHVQRPNKGRAVPADQPS